ncbi:hypothetical protein CVH10_14395 [Halomonas sp. ND22Bw]|nr:hypothetical protein CVH10_14395 [Halomonas sp. ND22Bw]
MTDTIATVIERIVTGMTMTAGSEGESGNGSVSGRRANAGRSVVNVSAGRRPGSVKESAGKRRTSDGIDRACAMTAGAADWLREVRCRR